MTRVTADQAIDLLAASGVPVEVRSASHIDIVLGGVVPMELKVRQAPTTPSQLTRDLRQADGRQLLYVVPRLTASLRNAAEKNGLAVVAVEDGVVLIGGQEYRPLSSDAATPTLPKSSRRTPWGRFALMRALCRTSAPRTQGQLAEEAGITQAAVSQSLMKLGDLVLRTPAGWAVKDIRLVADRFLAEYPGAGGVGVNWFALDPVNVQAKKVLNVGQHANAILSGDVGADRIAPWRIPTKAIVYTVAGLDLAKEGFAQTSAERATLELRVPADPTLWSTANAYTSARRSWTADPLIVAHDIRRTGGADADEAVEYVLKRLTIEWSER